MPLIACGVALLFFSLQHIRGIGLTPDGWAYWQGAGSLIDGYGYTYFDGYPIVFWPPLYSIYLAIWSSIIGLNGWALILANGTLVAIQGWLWCKLILLVWNDGEGPTSRLASLVVAIFVGCFTALSNQGVFAGVLQYAFLPLLVLATWKIINSTEHFLASWTVIAVVSGSGAMLTHNSSIVFLVATAILLAASKPKNMLGLATAAAIMGFPLLIWFVVRRLLGQTRSHAFGFGIGHFTPFEYVKQIVRGVGALIVPDRFGAPLILALGGAVLIFVFIQWKVSKRALWFGSKFGAVSALGLYVLFNVIWIHDHACRKISFVLPTARCPISYSLRTKIRADRFCRAYSFSAAATALLVHEVDFH